MVKKYQSGEYDRRSTCAPCPPLPAPREGSAALGGNSSGVVMPAATAAVFAVCLAVYCYEPKPVASVAPASLQGIESADPINTRPLIGGALDQAETDRIVKVPKNEAAPVSARQLSEDAANQYIKKYSDVACDEMKKYGILASISLAQGLVESRAGGSKLAKKHNNHFGIKCTSKKCAKGHCVNFTDDTHKDFFKKYKTPWECWRSHSLLLSSEHYADLKKCGNDYTKWAYMLKQLGYATDKQYAEKLIGMIERYDLQRFDK